MTLLPSATHMGLLACLGWTLLHSLWQSSALALALAGSLKISQRDSANRAYAISCTALLSMILCPCITFLWLRFGADPPSIPATVVLSHAGPLSLSGAEIPGHWSICKWLIVSADHRMRVISLFWSVGVLLFLGRLLFGFVGAKRLQRRRGGTVPERLQRAACRLIARLEITCPIRLTASAATTTPVVVGWLKPEILFPTGLLSTVAPEHLEAVLAHELAHIRRQDYLVNTIQMVIEALLFFHPGVWWVSKQIRREREHCCDDLAVTVSGSVLIYAKALVTLEEQRSPAQPQLLLGASGGHLAMRITRLFKQKLATPARGNLLALAAIAVLTLLALGILSPFAAEQVRAQTAEIPLNAAVPHLTPAARVVRPDMSCTFYDRSKHAHPGICEVPSQVGGPFSCKQVDEPQSKQHQSGCEWKVQRFQEWEHKQSGPKRR